MALHEDRSRASSFGEAAEQYDRARPRYPASLIDYLVRNDPQHIVDVGCGTGIASRLLRDRGCSVLGVEPDARMAAVAIASGCDVAVAPFETWNAEGRRFDLCTSAQAWHWIEPVAGFKKAAEVLNAGGMFSCFWNVGRPDTAHHDAFDACYRAIAPGIEAYSLLLGHGEPDRFSGVIEALEHDEHFTDITTTTYQHEITYTATAWTDHLDTHSDHHRLDATTKAALFQCISSAINNAGGTYTLSYEVVCISAIRTPR